jgi:hypothetical protein
MSLVFVVFVKQLAMGYFLSEISSSQTKHRSASVLSDESSAALNRLASPAV